MNLDTFRAQFFAGSPRYEWLETLGRGGMGVVFKALDRDLDEVVAIKVLYGHTGDDDGAILTRFKREISLNRKVKHPIYGKFVNKTKKLMAHDEENACNIGDTVRVMETRPLSKNKSWRLVEIIERAK